MDQAMLHLYTKKSNEYLQVDLGFSMGVLRLFTYDSQTKLTSEVPQDNSSYQIDFLSPPRQFLYCFKSGQSKFLNLKAFHRTHEISFWNYFVEKFHIEAS